MLGKTALKTYYRTNRITKVDAYGSPVMYQINTVICTHALLNPITRNTFLDINVYTVVE